MDELVHELQKAAMALIWLICVMLTAR